MTCCPIGSEGTGRYVCGVGGAPNKLMIVGEAPGELEDATGFPFVGPAGALLEDVLERNGITEYYLTNVCKCRPMGNRKPRKEEIAACSGFLLDELSEVRPEYIMLLGATAVQALIGSKVSMEKVHGRVVTREPYKFLPTYHPSAVLHQPKVRPLLELDIATFAKILRGDKAPRVTVRGTGMLAVDVEVEDNRVWCVGWSENGAGKSSVSTRLSDLPRTTQPVMHNAQYDLKKLRAEGVDLTKYPVEDTMIRAHLLGLPGSLKVLANSLLGMEMRSLDEILGRGKKAVRMGEKANEVLDYCMRDAKATRLLLSKLQLPENLERVYRGIDQPLIPILVELEETGFYTDRELLLELKREAESEIAKSVEALRELGIDNPGSDKQVAEVLYSNGIRPPKLTESGRPSVDEESLLLLKSSAPALVDALLNYRKFSKQLSTYILPWLESRDGRVRPSYNIDGTGTGRLSSSNPNGQNITRGKLREVIIPTPGYRLVKADASQLEMRVMGLWSGDPKMLAFLRAGSSYHIETCKELFSTDDKNSEAYKIAKVINFAIAYGGTWRVILQEALKLGIPLTRETAQRFERLYFQKFPGLATKIMEQKALARAEGKVYNMFGRERRLYGFGGSYQEVETAYKQAINTPIQGTAGDMVKKLMVEFAPILKEHGGRFVLQVHDDIPMEVPDEEAGWIPEIKGELERILSEMFSFPFPVEVKEISSYAE